MTPALRHAPEAIEKICTKCGQTKALTEYPRKSHNADGRMAECRDCNHLRYLAKADAHYQRTRAYILAHPEKVAEWKRREREKARAQRAEQPVRPVQPVKPANPIVPRKAPPHPTVRPVKPVVVPSPPSWLALSGEELCATGAHYWIITAGRVFGGHTYTCKRCDKKEYRGGARS